MLTCTMGTKVLKQMITVNIFYTAMYDAKITPKQSEISKGESQQGAGTGDFDSLYVSLKVNLTCNLKEPLLTLNIWYMIGTQKNLNNNYDNKYIQTNYIFIQLQIYMFKFFKVIKQ